MTTSFIWDLVFNLAVTKYFRSSRSWFRFGVNYKLALVLSSWKHSSKSAISIKWYSKFVEITICHAFSSPAIPRIFSKHLFNRTLLKDFFKLVPYFVFALKSICIIPACFS